MTSKLKSILPEKIPALAAIFYNAVPARIFRPHYRAVAEEIHLNDGEVLVDIGTGPGLLPVEIAKRFPRARVIGIDLSPKMIEIALRHKTRNGSLDNLEFKLMDAKALEFESGSLDAVVSTGAYHHWKEPVLVLNEIHRCLKKDRQAWIYDGYGDARDEDIAKCIQRLSFGFPPNILVRKILGLHGFSRQEYETIVKDTVSRSLFKTCALEVHGIMMRLGLKKTFCSY